MNNIVFLETNEVCEIQTSILLNAPSRDTGLVDSALARVLNKYNYEDVRDIFELAALYLVSLAKAHTFPDGNKRTAFIAALVFLKMNGIWLENNFDELIAITIEAATSNIDFLKVAARLKCLVEI